MNKLIKQRIKESIDVKANLLSNDQLLYTVEKMAESIADCLKNGHKLVLCGNGGSASDALHFAGEITGRFQKERPAWPAIALNADVATMTAIANDYGFDDIFARQAMGIVHEGDVFVGISTSGNSENVCRATEVVRQKGVTTGALLGKNGGRLALISDYPIIVPCMTTARIQECHILLIHIMCEMVEDRLT